MRGFVGLGNEITYIGYPTESCNVDVYAVDIFIGALRRLTTHPGYTDPVEFSPDGKWFVVMDTRGSGRSEFMDGLRWLPPVTDLVTTTACASVGNNDNRRFFQPYLLDQYGHRNGYYGQSLNNGQSGFFGSGDFDDPQWNGGADPWFSPDGTKIVFWQTQAVSSACGGDNPLPCYNSTEPGGVDARILVAHLTTRSPIQHSRDVEVYPDVIPWAVPYVSGMTIQPRSYLHQGDYILRGLVSGVAKVRVLENAAKTGIQTIAMELFDYADDYHGAFSGYQIITAITRGITTTVLDWYSNLIRFGESEAVQYTSSGGFHMSIDVLTNKFEANGSLVTVVDGETFSQPVNGG